MVLTVVFSACDVGGPLATGVHGNPKEWVEIVLVTASTGSIQTIDTAGARADLRPVP